MTAQIQPTTFTSLLADKAMQSAAVYMNKHGMRQADDSVLDRILSNIRSELRLLFKNLLTLEDVEMYGELYAQEAVASASLIGIEAVKREMER